MKLLLFFVPYFIGWIILHTIDIVSIIIGGIFNFISNLIDNIYRYSSFGGDNSGFIPNVIVGFIVIIIGIVLYYTL